MTLGNQFPNSYVNANIQLKLIFEKSTRFTRCVWLTKIIYRSRKSTECQNNISHVHYLELRE